MSGWGVEACEVGDDFINVVRSIKLVNGTLTFDQFILL